MIQYQIKRGDILEKIYLFKINENKSEYLLSKQMSLVINRIILKNKDISKFIDYKIGYLDVDYLENKQTLKLIFN